MVVPPERTMLRYSPRRLSMGLCEIGRTADRDGRISFTDSECEELVQRVELRSISIIRARVAAIA
jgi:hypothetical protein